MAERAIFESRAASTTAPVLLVASFSHPHDPFAVPQRYWDLYRDEDIDMPRAGTRSTRIRGACATFARWMRAGDRGSGARRAPRLLRRDHLCRRPARPADGGARAAGWREDTIVILTSDHGEMLGERGLWYKMSFFEGSCRVPLVIASPGRFEPRRVALRVSLVDLMPTLIDLAGGNAASLASASTGAASRPISAARADMTRRSANISPKARSRRS